MVERTPKILKEIKKDSLNFTRETVLTMPHHKRFSTEHSVAELCASVSSVLQKQKYKTHFSIQDSDLKLSAAKNDFSKWASLIFHFSFIVILSGALYGYLFGMKGYVELLEGQPFQEKHGNYALLSEGALFKERHSGKMVVLSKFQPSYYEDGTPQDYRAQFVIATKNHSFEERTLRVNQPVTSDGVRFYYNKHGFAALLKIKMNGETKYEWVAFEENQGRYIRKGILKSTGLPFHAVFTPNKNLAGGLSKKRESKDPWVFIRFSEHEKASLPLGGHRYFLGAAVDFLEVKHWAGFSVVKDPGLPVVYFGFILCIAGLFLMVFFVPRAFYVYAERGLKGEAQFFMGLKSEKYIPFLHEELEHVADEVMEKLTRYESKYEEKQKVAAC